MADQIAIPAGVNPNSAVPPDARQYGTSTPPGAPADAGGIPPVAPVSDQKPGFTPAAAKTPDQLEFEQFQAWKAAQVAKPPVQVETRKEPPTEPKPTATSSLGAQGAIEAVKTAGAHDPVVSNTFTMLGLVAPDLDVVRALGNAIDRGDASLIDKAYIAEIGKDKAAQLVQLAENMVNHVNKQVENLVQSTYTMAGGEAQWNAAAATFNQSAPKYLKQYVADNLDSANPERIQAGAAAMLDFVKQSGALPTPPSGHVRAGGGTPDASLGLSKEQYQAERLKLDRRARDYPDRSRELDARRQIGKKLGL